VATQQQQKQHSGSEGATEKAQELASQAKEQAQNLQGRATQQVRSQIDTHSTKFGEQVSSFGGALRAAGERLDSEGNSAGSDAANRAAEQVDRLASYLRESDSDRLLADVERFARTRPWAAGALGLMTGFVAARFLKASSEGRYASAQAARADADLPLRREATETGYYAPASMGI
jgi:hypothetical protein